MANKLEQKERWANGQAYVNFVGRWSARVAAEFIPWLRVHTGKRWLDVGCGTGTLVKTVLDVAAPEAVVGVDRSEAFIEHARAQISDSRVTFRVADAQALQVERGSFDAVVSGLVLTFVDKPERMVMEMTRACRLYGAVAAYVWDYAGEMQFLRYFWEAAREVDPAAAELDEGARFPLANARALWNLFLDAGLQDVQTRAIVIPTVFDDFDDFWKPFLGGQGAAPAYVATLSEDKRNELREALRARLPAQKDGSIALTARAWAVRGTR